MRLIPGGAADIGRGAKKLPQSVRLNEMLMRNRTSGLTGRTEKMAGDFRWQHRQGPIEGLRKIAATSRGETYSSLELALSGGASPRALRTILNRDGWCVDFSMISGHWAME